jgi:very-short-patch-repair endonuclease
MDISLARRRQLRRNSTEAEALLWRHLRGHRFAGFKFRRQHPCGPFILDFFCARRNLAIELDGGQHFATENQHRDALRTNYLAQRGIMVIRFPTDLVFREADAVLTAIAVALGINDPSP